MKVTLLTGTIGAILLMSPFTYAQDQKPAPTKATQAKGSGMSHNMREAIEWERAKDRAAARQAAIEARSGNTDSSANRTADDKTTSSKVKASKMTSAKKPRQ